MVCARLCTVLTFLVTSSFASLEWPVFFEHLGFVHSIHNRWDLTVSVKLHLPSMEARLSKTLHRLRLLDHQYEQHEETSARPEETTRSQDPSRIEELHESWARLNQHLVHRTLNLKRRAEDLRGLEGTNRHRRKRQDNGPFGGILRTLFGVAYANEVSDVSTKLNQIDGRLTSDIGSVRSSHSDLKTRAEQQLRKHEIMLSDVEKMTYTLERKVADMETNPILKTNLGEIVRSRNEQYQSLQLEIDLMEERMSEIERVVICLSAGKLSKDVLPPKQLRQTLQNIERQLPGNYSLLFPADEPLWPYYSVLTSTANFDYDLETAVVQVNIPLVDLASILDLHRVHNLPLKVKEGYSVTADIATDYLVTDYSKTYFLELNKEDFQDCQVYHNGLRGQHFYCGLKPMLKGQEARSCVMQLYQGQSDPTWCQSRLRHGLVQPFERLYNGSWIFSALHEDIRVRIACPDGHDSVTQLAGFGVISMAEGCTVTSEDFKYPHTFTGSITLSLSFGDRGWDTAEYLTDVPLNESLFNHSHEYQEQVEDDAITFGINEIETEPLLPLLIEAVEAETEDDLLSTGRSSTTVLAPSPTDSTENLINDTVKDEVVDKVDIQVETTVDTNVDDNIIENPSSPSTPLFSFFTTEAGVTPPEAKASDSVQSSGLNVEIPDEVATTVKYDLLIKLAEKFKNHNWLSV